MSRLKLGVVGVGALGRHHARILSEMKNVDLVGVAEVDPQQGKRVARACDTTWYATPAELLGQVDAASIVVPSVYHLNVAEAFIAAGIPVMVEKPLAATLDEARQLFEQSQKQGCLVQTGHIERFNPAFQEIVKNCSSPRYIRSERLAPYTFRSTDIGVVHDLMIHDIDLALTLADSPVKKVEAFGATVVGGHEDSAQARICFENGCLADLVVSRVHPEARRTLHCWGYEGSFSANLETREVNMYRPTETLRYGTPLPARAAQAGADIEQMKADIFGKYIAVETVKASQEDVLTAELQSFVDCVNTGATPVVDAEAGLAAMEVAEQVLQSVGRHQWEGTAEGPVGPQFQIAHPAARRRAA